MHMEIKKDTKRYNKLIPRNTRCIMHGTLRNSNTKWTATTMELRKSNTFFYQIQSYYITFNRNQNGLMRTEMPIRIERHS